MALLDEDREEIKNIFGELLGGEKEKWKLEQQQKEEETEETEEQKIPPVKEPITNEELKEQEQPEEVKEVKSTFQKIGEKLNHLW